MDMKIVTVITFTLLLLIFPAWSQDAVFIAPETDEIATEDYEVEPRARGLQGIVAQIFRVMQPLQLINPFAPKSFGTGEANVSADDSFSKSYPGQPGLIVFGTEFE